MAEVQRKSYNIFGKRVESWPALKIVGEYLEGLIVRICGQEMFTLDFHHLSF